MNEELIKIEARTVKWRRITYASMIVNPVFGGIALLPGINYHWLGACYLLAMALHVAATLKWRRAQHGMNKLQAEADAARRKFEFLAAFAAVQGPFYTLTTGDGRVQRIPAGEGL